MIISHGRKYIFVHIPKTGGTSLALALEGRAMKDDILIGDTPKAVKRRRRLKDLKTSGRLWKHSMLSDIDGLVSADDIQSFFTFTMVRNPWDRMVSYYHWLQKQSFDHPAVALAKSLGFKDFIRYPQTVKSISQNPYGRYMTPRAAAENCDLFIRLEHFQNDAQPLFDHLGFGLDLPHENASERGRDYRTYYSEDDADHITQICAEDIKRFDYSF